MWPAFLQTVKRSSLARSWAHRLGLAPLVRPAADPELYRAWLDQRLARRAPPGPLPAVRMSVVTCVYERTPVDCLREAAASLAAQTWSRFEWVILAQGPLSAELATLLARLEREPHVRMLRQPHNEGIMRGLRRCLEAAAGDYIVPLDGDDLLTADALELLAAAIHRHQRPALLYTDEDVLADGRLQHPLFRPDWDPVLNLASSYIWHTLCFSRPQALALGVYTRTECEFCQDWDTVALFAAAGESPVHVPEVTYHWRAHDRSSTHQPRTHVGSLESQRALLAHAVPPDVRQRFEIRPFPLFRGRAEWALTRKPIEPVSTDLVLVASTPSPAEPHLRWARVHCVPSRFPIRQRHSMASNGAVDSLREILARCESEFVFIGDDRLRPLGASWLWDALGLFDLHPNLAFVGGRIASRTGRILDAGRLWCPSRLTHCPTVGLHTAEPGPRAFALKPRCVDTVPAEAFFARTSDLREALRVIPPAATWGGLAAWLGGWAADHHRLVATTPLFTLQAPAAWRAGQPTTAEAQALRGRLGSMLARSRWAITPPDDLPAPLRRTAV